MLTHEIIGDDMQAVVLAMAAGDEVRAEAGAMTYMTDGIEMDALMHRVHQAARRRILRRGRVHLRALRGN